MTSMQFMKVALIAVPILFVILLFAGTWFTVEQGERAVVLRNGAFLYVADPGLHLKLPLIDSVTEMDVRTQKLVFDNVASYSKDIQQSASSLAVTYTLPEANVEEVFTKLGTKYAERVIWPAVYDRFKEVMGRYTAAEIVSNRQQIGDEVMRSIREDVGTNGIFINQVQLQNIDFTDVFEKAIEQAVKAKAEVTEAEQILLKKTVEAKTKVVQAEAEAQAARVRAKGEADAIDLKAKAEANAYRLKSEGLSVVLVEAMKAEKWDGKLPTTMLPNTAVPMFNVNK